LVARLLRRLLAHPLTDGMSIDDPATTEFRKIIVLSKQFLRAIYEEWYRMLAAELPEGDGRVLELGSGAGFGDQYIRGLITSEVFYCPNAQVVINAQQLPFGNESLRAIIFTDVVHHLPDVRRFFSEAFRCLGPDGKILMIEPSVTSWSSFVYKHFHNEPFCPTAQQWSCPVTGPLSGANGALAWIILVRDRETYESEFPKITIEYIRPFLPLRYLLSGGVSMRVIMPQFIHTFWVRLERALEPLMHHPAMFAFVSLRRR
jgi:SAM-dependent methyltransferase